MIASSAHNPQAAPAFCHVMGILALAGGPQEIFGHLKHPERTTITHFFAPAWRSMAVSIGHWQIRGYGFFSLESKETGEWVGRVGPWCPEGWPGPEVGWTISPRHLRQGYATEAARASLDFAFNTLGWDSVIHCIMEGNEASIGVARNIGSAYLRTEQGLPGVCDETILIYGQDRPSKR